MYKNITIGFCLAILLIILLNKNLLAIDCDIQLALQNGMFEEDIAPLNIGNDILVVGGYALTAGKGISVTDFVNASPNLIEINFQKYLKLNAAKFDIESVSTLILDIEQPITIENLFKELSIDEERLKLIEAYIRRINAVKKTLPNKRIGLFGIPSVPADPAYNSSNNRKDILAAYKYGGENGLFNQVDMIYPTLYFRWGKSEKRPEFVSESIRTTLEELDILKNAYTKNKKIVPLLSIKVFNGRSRYNNQCVPIATSSRMLEYLAESDFNSFIFWLGKAKSMDDENWCSPRLYFEKLKKESSSFCEFN